MFEVWSTGFTGMMPTRWGPFWKSTNYQLLADRSSSTCMNDTLLNSSGSDTSIRHPPWWVMVLVCSEPLLIPGAVSIPGHQALGLNEFGDLVVTSRGVHLIQRIGWVTSVSLGSADQPKLGSKMGRGVVPTVAVFFWGGGKGRGTYIESNVLMHRMMSELPVASLHSWHCSWGLVRNHQKSTAWRSILESGTIATELWFNNHLKGGWDDTIKESEFWTLLGLTGLIYFAGLP